MNDGERRNWVRSRIPPPDDGEWSGGGPVPVTTRNTPRPLVKDEVKIEFSDVVAALLWGAMLVGSAWLLLVWSAGWLDVLWVWF